MEVSKVLKEIIIGYAMRRKFRYLKIDAKDIISHENRHKPPKKIIKVEQVKIELKNILDNLDNDRAVSLAEELTIYSSEKYGISLYPNEVYLAIGEVQL